MGPPYPHAPFAEGSEEYSGMAEWCVDEMWDPGFAEGNHPTKEHHDKFAEDCSQSKVDQLISYNSDQLVKDRFTESKWKAAEFDLTYTMRSVGEYMRNQKTRKELLLFNYGIEGLA